MENNQLMRDYFDIPKLNLIALLDLDFKQLLEVELEVVNDWIKNKRCECSKSLDIQNKRISLRCKHIREEIRNKTFKLEKRMDLKSDVLLFRNITTPFHGDKN